MELQESVNIDIARKLNALTLAQYSLLYKKCSNKRDEEGKETDMKAEFTKLKNYCKDIIASKNNLSVNYGFTEGKDFGRLQSKTSSVQRIFNGFRGLLCDGITYDLDMKNAHPNILKNLCTLHDIKCPYLEDYINHRDEWLDEMMRTYKIDKFTAKATFLTMINKDESTKEIGGKKIKAKPEKFMSFDKEMKNILTTLFTLYKKDYFKYVKNESWNQKGKMINLLLCKEENLLLKKAEKYIKSKGIKIHTRMYDGCMVYKTDKDGDEYDEESLINGLNKRFKDDNIVWTIKQHNTELLKSLEEIKLEEKDTYMGADIEEISNHILETILKDKIIRTETGIVLLNDEKIETKEIEIDRDLYALISKQDYNITEQSPKGEDKIVKVSTLPTKIKELVYSIKAKAPKDNKFLQNIWNETKGRLYFKNGYYDFKQKEFIKGQFNRTPIKIDRNYNDIVSLKDYNDLYNNILYPIFSIKNKEEDKTRVQLMEYFLYRLSRIMAGHIEDKKWVLLEGLRNSGKGVITLLLENAFERYVKITNSGNFVFKENTQDEAKKQSWMIDYQFVRLAFTQEITINKQSRTSNKVDGNMIKKFCSGGDSIEARKNHQDEYQFKIQASLMICCNDMPEITPNDTKEFCEEFQMKSKFLTKEQEETETKIPTYIYYEAKDTVKENVKEDRYINAFIQLLLQAYKTPCIYPKALKQQLEDVKEEDDYTKLYNLFTITDNKKDFISNSKLEELIEEKFIPFTTQKCKNLLIAIGAKADRNKSSRGLSCIKQKTNRIIPAENDEDDDPIEIKKED
jgi:hypothetical protein